MKIHEYQGKELLAAAGAAVPRGIVVTSADAAVAAFDTMGGPVVLKSQIHAGGRGKGHFKGHDNPKLGGVKFVAKREDVRPLATVMLSYPLVTKQTGSDGQKVSTLLVQEGVDIAREVYLGMVLDRAIGLPIMMGCADGGVEIEEVAATHPEKILKVVVDPDAGLHPCQARRLAYELGFKGDEVAHAEKLMHALSKVYLEKDASIAEINPVVVTPKGEVLALDAKFVFDDNALFKHPEIEKYRDLTEENPSEVRAGKSGLSYISLHGNIGCLVNGAGLAMSTMDIIKYHGGEPANFLDVGGGATTETVTEGFRILLSDPTVKAVLVNIFGGIMKCDTIANAILSAFKEVGFHVPLVVRLEGTNVELGRKLLSESGLAIETAKDLTEAAKKVVAATR